MKVYLDNAATTPIAQPVIEVMKEAMEINYGNPSSIHSMGRNARSLVESSRKTVAEILKASAGEIFFTSSATESNNMAIHRSIVDLGVRRIISSPTEHPCVLNTLKAICVERNDVDVQFLSVDAYGRIDTNELNHLLESSDIKTLVSIMHGNNEIGTMIDLDKVSQICDNHNALLHCDTVQTIGKFDLDLSKTKVSFLSGSGHKIYGPKGIGIIYINNDNMTKAMINGGGQERQLRSGTENIYGIAGFAKALSLMVEERDQQLGQIMELRNYFKSEAPKYVSDIQYNGNQDDLFLPHILSISIPKTMKTDLIMFNLDIYGICASAGSACSSGAEKDSHVLEAINAPSDRKTIRFSFSHHNTKDEILHTLKTLADVSS